MSHAAVLLLLAACTCEAAPEPAAEDRGASPRDFFPARPGDRWRMDSGESLAVTALTEDGVAVFFGSDRTSAERYRVTDDAVLLVTPEGEAIAPWLERPMEVGHRWRYSLGDAQCEAQYATVETTAEVAGLSFEHCIEVRRRCQYPAGKPFPVATAELREETWCPYVGRVEETLRLDPRPSIEGAPAERRWRVAYYRVAGAPAPPRPERFDCDGFLLMETDVQAACGPRLRQTERSDEGGCTLRFAGPDGELTVHAERLDRPVTADDADAQLTALAPEASVLRDEDDLRIRAGEGMNTEGGAFALAQGEHVIAVRWSAACPLERARRLAPLLRSLVSE